MDIFYGNSLTQKYINNILYNSEVPLIDFVKEGDLVIKGFVYIYEYQIIQCTTTGNIGEDAKYTIIELYFPWTRYAKYTRNHININGFYNNQTHRKLGDYLRAFAYNNGINLMSMYNCYDYTSANNIEVVGTKIEQVETTGSKIALVPIKFNKTYAISIESKSLFHIAPILYSEQKLDTAMIRGEEVDITNTYLNDIRTYASSDFHKPIMFSVDLSKDMGDDVLAQLYKRQHDLYLMIEVNKANNTTIVVLEGNYTNTKTPDYRVGNPLTEEDYTYSPILQMYQMDMQIPYSPNLIQYLISSAIYSSRENDYNVKKLREELGLDPKGGYNSEVRALVFNKAMESPITFKGDILGYVDSNVERVI